MDFGGGDGLVCRLLRDLGFDAYDYDKYALNFYAHGYVADLAERYDIVTCFEVWEHLPRPREEFERLFSKRPFLLIGSTDMYHHQGAEWAYLGPEQGGHVFFYSEKAMKHLATQFGYDVVTRGSTTVFSKAPFNKWQRFVLGRALAPIGLLIGRLWMQIVKPQR